MFNAIKKDTRNFLLSSLLVIAIVAPLTALGTFGVEHYLQEHRQVGVTNASHEEIPANSSTTPSHNNLPSKDQASLTPDEGGYQDRQGNALDGSQEPPRIIFEEHGREFGPFIAIFFAILVASSIAYLIGFRSARKGHQRHNKEQ